jgi:hypothetical protein
VSHALAGRAPTGDLLAGGLAAATLGAACLGAAAGAAGEDSPVLCPLRAATGIPCPFCGLTRSVGAAGAGDLDGSLRLSLLGLPAIVAAAVLLALLARARVAGRGLRWSRPALVLGAIAVAANWIVLLARGAP